MISWSRLLTDYDIFLYIRSQKPEARMLEMLFFKYKQKKCDNL